MTTLPHPVIQVQPTEVLGELNEVEEKNAPPSLFLVGDRALLEEGRRVSVVGSRRASSNGLTRARVLCQEFVASGLTVVSGLAEGIDTVAHTTAVSEGGRTIAVLGTPLNVPYPKSNADLYAQIMRDHLAVSQFPFGYPSRRENWPRRNRTMALISDATVIVEASEKSGTVHQGWEALRLGRPLFLLESLASNPELSWPQEMLKYGAQVLTRANLQDVIQDIPERSLAHAFDF